MDEREDEAPLWQREDPYLDAHGELPIEEQHHRDRVDAAFETVRTAGVALIIPIGLVMLMASLVLGDWVWKVLFVLPVLLYFALVAIPLVARLRQDGDLRLPGRPPLSGAQKRSALILALGLALLVIIFNTYGGIWHRQTLDWLRATLLG